MKMLYVYIGGGKGHSSVQAKIVSKIDYFNRNGMATKGAFFSLSEKEHSELNQHISIIPIPRTDKRFFKAIFDQRSSLQTAVDYIKKVETDYDVIYIRYPGASKWLYAGMKSFGHKVVFEHNTKELDEVIMRAQDNQFGLRPSKLLSWLQDNRYRIWSEKKYAPKCIALAQLGLANTNEIVSYQKNRVGGKYNCVLLTNGVDLEKIPKRKPVSFDGKNLKMFLMRGAQGLVPYDGTDRLLKGMANYKGDTNLKLYFIGNSFLDEEAMVKDLKLEDQVEFTGKMIGDDLTNLINECHLSYGTLALHRKNQSEGSVLRVNESLARGIPVVVAYEDMELNADDGFKPFYLKLEANDEVIDMQEIVDFAKRVYGITDNHDQIRDLAKKNIDYNIKINQSIDYIKGVFA